MKKILFIPLLIIFLFLSQMAKADFGLDAVKVICTENNFSVVDARLSDDVFEQILRNNEFSLIKNGMFKKNSLGIMIGNITEEIAKEHNLKVKAGIFINEVFENSAADKSGLKNNDIITSLNNEVINDAYSFVDRLGELELGSKISLDVTRHKDSSLEKINLDVILAIKDVELEGYGNELWDIFYEIQDNENDMKKLKDIAKNEKNLLINYHQEEFICEIQDSIIKTTFNIIPTSGKGQCGAGDWGFTFSQTINDNTTFNDFHMGEGNCFSILEPDIQKVDISFVNPKRIKVKLSGQWNDKGINSSNLPLDEIFINKNFLGCDKLFDYEPQCENEFEIKELEFNLK